MEATISRAEEKRVVYRNFVAGKLCAQEARAVLGNFQIHVPPCEIPDVERTGWVARLCQGR
ncbi:MAG TPA: hypothetical protein VM492_13995 [Sumerlaeia bacterium]|nr:hypothetical protein [Sumerlaeia bacterium]